MCLQYLTTDTQVQNVFVFLSHDVILSSIIPYVARITGILADLGLCVHKMTNNSSTGFMFYWIALSLNVSSFQLLL